MGAVPPFYPDVHASLSRAALSSLAAWWIARVALGLPVAFALALVCAVIAGSAGPALVRRRRAPRVSLHHDGIAIGAEHVAWASMRSALIRSRAGGEHAGTRSVNLLEVRLQDARTMWITNADAMGGVSAAPPGDIVIDVEDADALSAVVLARTGASRSPAALPVHAAPRGWNDSRWIEIGILVLLVLRIATALDVASPAPWRALLQGIASVAVATILGAFVAPHIRVTRRAAALAAALLVATACLLLPAASATRDGALATALVLALPAPPFPGATLVNTLVAKLGDRALAGLTAVAFALATVLALREMTLLPTALIAAAIRGYESWCSVRRSAHCAAARAIAPGCPELECAIAAPGVRGVDPLAVTVGLVAGIAALAVCARQLLHDAVDPGMILWIFRG